MDDASRWINPVLDGPLTHLRGIDHRDSGAMWEMVNDEVGADLTATSASFTRTQIDDWCATRSSEDLRIDLAIVERRTGMFAGEAVLNEYNPEEESVNFRISLRVPLGTVAASGLRQLG